MTCKKMYTILTIFCVLSIICIWTFQNSALNAFLAIIGAVVSTLLRGYAKDYEDKQKEGKSSEAMVNKLD